MAVHKPTVLVTRRLPEDVEQRLKQEFNVLMSGEGAALSAEQIEAHVASLDAICPTVADRIDARLLRQASRLRLIANFGVGYNNVDIATARELGIVVTNTPDVLTEATADLTMTLLLMAARRAGEGERLCRSGRWEGWNPLQLLGHDVSFKVLGLVGFGRIARAVARRAHDGFGMRILIFSRSQADARALARYDARQCADLDELLACSDFVSLHCPSTPATRHLIDGAALRRMQRSAFLINTARGDVVDEGALAEALRAGTLGGAGLDVYEKEPAIDPRLLQLDNVVLLPHLGSATRETRSAMGQRMADNLTEFFAGREPRDRVV
jgi:glyoxylate reductase